MNHDTNKGPNALGKVRSNFMGTEFIFYDNGLNPGKVKSVDQIR
jgi:tubby-related protein 1